MLASIRREAALSRSIVAGLLLACGTSACIPYTAGTTAKPLPAGARSTTLSTYVMPSVGGLDSAYSESFFAVDFETRFGVDDRSDVGLRALSLSGVTLDYKRLLTGPDVRADIAIIPGFGFVN